jgi:uncharacterized protein (TIGR03435 family)
MAHISMIAFCSVFLTGVGSTALAQRSDPLEVGQAAPPLTIDAWGQLPNQLPEGVNAETGYSWESLRGTTVVLEFWATWCGPCVAAIPHMNDLAEQFQGEVVFISVTDEPEEKTLALREKRPLKSVLGFDPDKSMLNAYGVRGIPATFVVDKEGKIASITHPNRLTAEKLRGHIGGKHDEPAAKGGGAEPWSIGAISSGVDPFDRQHNVPVGQLIFRKAVGANAFSTGSGPTNITMIDASPLELVTYVHEVQSWQVRMPEDYDDEKAQHYDLIVRLPATTFGDQHTLVRSLVLSGMDMQATVKDARVPGYLLSRVDGASKLEAADPIEPGGYNTSGFTFNSAATNMHSFAWWLQGVLRTPLDTDLDLQARYVIDFGVHAEFDPTNADDVAMLRQKLEDELGLVLEPKENTMPIVIVSKKPDPAAN